MSNIKNQEPKDENGKRHGEWIVHYDDGQLWYNTNYVHGNEHGLDETYYADGRLEHRGNYHMGKRIDYWCIQERRMYFLNLI